MKPDALVSTNLFTLKMNRVPPDALSVVFDHLDVVTCLRCRAVCRDWRRISGTGCGHFVLKPGELKNTAITCVLLAGRSTGASTNNGEDNGDSDGNGDGSQRGDSSESRTLKRTRGHLPNPEVLVDGQGTTHDITFIDWELWSPTDGTVAELDGVHDGASTKCFGFAMKIEQHCRADGDSGQNVATKFQSSLDLEASLFGVFSFPVPLQPRPLKRRLKEVDLGGLRHLRRLSVRGCSSLETLRLPPSLTALDASACSSLRRIYLPFGIDDGLVAVNLGGCRSLQSQGGGGGSSSPASLLGPTTEGALRHARDLDLSSVSQRHCDGISTSLRGTATLISVSMRYAATDAVLLALARSASALGGTLRLVDVAFSPEVSDASVDELADSATALERLNLRGCRGVSAECYNRVPVFLETRRSSESVGRGGDVGLSPTEIGGVAKKGRKGDNVFFFVDKNGSPSRRTRKET